MNIKPVRSVREPLRKPRPLKTSASTDQIKCHITDPKDSVVQKSRDEILADLEILNVSISNCSFDDITAMDISRMCAILKKRGEELDTFHKDAVDRYFCTLRNACREERLDMLSRVKLLETIELRARNWKRNENINNYFNMKIQELEKGLDNYSGVISPTIPGPVPNQNLTPTTGIPLAHGEILRSSGKFDKPTKIAGKNYFKDEIVIRNSDSGKVNPGARDRLVQITGPHEESIGHAKLLVEDTIRRNASPVRDNADLSGFDNSKEADFGNSFSSLDNQMSMKKSLQHSFSMGDASLREHSFPLQVGQEFLTLTGTNPELLKTARLVLKEFFAGQSELLEKQHENITSLNRQTSPDSNMLRFQLRKQSSKNNIENNYNTSWQYESNRSLKRDSVSPFSSSDDDVIRDESRGDSGRFRHYQSQSSGDSAMSPPEMKSRSISLSQSSGEYAKLSRSSSVPDATIRSYSGFPEIYQSDEEVFPRILPSEDSENPPIPPPSYKKIVYDREFLLNCAKSPLSHTQPSDYAHIHQNFKDIVCQSPIMFDPAKYEESKLEESTVCVLK